MAAKRRGIRGIHKARIPLLWQVCGSEFGAYAQPSPQWKLQLRTAGSRKEPRAFVGFLVATYLELILRVEVGLKTDAIIRADA
jgi:hypothetical protein